MCKQIKDMWGVLETEIGSEAGGESIEFGELMFSAWDLGA